MRPAARPERWHDATSVRIALVVAVAMLVAAAVVGTRGDAGSTSVTSSAPPTTSGAVAGVFGDGAGSSKAQRAAAEQLLGDVRAAAPAFATTDQAEAAGYVSLGDAYSGVEHFTSWSAIADGRDLDVEHPEGLLYAVGADGGRTLVAMLFLRAEGTQVSEAPRIGGPLTRWYAWSDLCRNPGPPPAITAAADAAGACPKGLEPLSPFPTLHVWVVTHSCGPFSELESNEVRRGRSAQGCIHQHGS